MFSHFDLYNNGPLLLKEVLQISDLVFKCLVLDGRTKRLPSRGKWNVLTVGSNVSPSVVLLASTFSIKIFYCDKMRWGQPESSISTININNKVRWIRYIEMLVA